MGARAAFRDKMRSNRPLDQLDGHHADGQHQDGPQNVVQGESLKIEAPRLLGTGSRLTS